METIIGTAIVDSSLVHNDNYLYHNINRGNTYPVLVSYTANSGKELLKIRDNNGVGRWVEAVYFKVDYKAGYNEVPKTSLRSCLWGWFVRSVLRMNIDTGKEYKPVEGLKIASTGDPFIDQFLLIYGP